VLIRQLFVQRRAGNMESESEESDVQER